MMQVAETETFPAVLVWDSFASSQPRFVRLPRSSMTFHSPAKSAQTAVFQRISWLSTDCHLYFGYIIASANPYFPPLTRSRFLTRPENKYIQAMSE
jgi:hypothetical protein